MLFLRPAELAEKCFLHEVLYWLAFARLPIATYNLWGFDPRDDPESLEYEAQVAVRSLPRRRRMRLCWNSSRSPHGGTAK